MGRLVVLRYVRGVVAVLEEHTTGKRQVRAKSEGP